MVTQPPTPRGTGRRDATRSKGTIDETPLRDYLFAALGLSIAVVAALSLSSVLAAIAGSFGSLSPLALVSLFVVLWLAIWTSLQTAWMWLSAA